MATEVFLDTAYALALASPSDQLHDRAVELAEQLETERTRLVSTMAVLLEIGNALSKRRYRAAAVQLLVSLEADPSVEILPLSPELYADAFQLYTSSRVNRLVIQAGLPPDQIAIERVPETRYRLERFTNGLRTAQRERQSYQPEAPASEWLVPAGTHSLALRACRVADANAVCSPHSLSALGEQRQDSGLT